VLKQEIDTLQKGIGYVHLTREENINQNIEKSSIMLSLQE